MPITKLCGYVCLALAILVYVGCSKPANNQPVAGDHDHDHAHGDHDHDHDHDHIDDPVLTLNGYWCVEHGVPEDGCALCNPKLVAEFKAKGDWCEKHNRPNSQCFTCNPQMFDTYAALYEAKSGKQPPKPTENGD
jgi:hypothetical protein